MGTLKLVVVRQLGVRNVKGVVNLVGGCGLVIKKMDMLGYQKETYRRPRLNIEVVAQLVQAPSWSVSCACMTSVPCFCPPLFNPLTLL